jgi:hypothetical protein
VRTLLLGYAGGSYADVWGDLIERPGVGPDGSPFYSLGFICIYVLSNFVPLEDMLLGKEETNAT